MGCSDEEERRAEMVRLRDVLDNYQGELERLLQERTRLDARILHCSRNVFYRHIGVNTVLIEQIDNISS